MNQINVQYYKTKIGELILGSFDGKLCLLDFKYRKSFPRILKRIKEYFGLAQTKNYIEALEKAFGQKKYNFQKNG